MHDEVERVGQLPAQQVAAVDDDHRARRGQPAARRGRTGRRAGSHSAGSQVHRRRPGPERVQHLAAQRRRRRTSRSQPASGSSAPSSRRTERGRRKSSRLHPGHRPPGVRDRRRDRVGQRRAVVRARAPSTPTRTPYGGSPAAAGERQRNRRLGHERGQGGGRERRDVQRRAGLRPRAASTTSCSVGLVAAEPSGKTTVGTVWLPPLTLITKSAESASCSMLTSV